MRRFTLELSEKLGMTEGAMLAGMSGLELRRRMVLEKVRHQEHEKQMKKAKR